MKKRLTVALSFVLSAALFSLVMLRPLWRQPEEAAQSADGTGGVRRSVWVVFHDSERLTGLVRVFTDTRSMTVEAVGYPPHTEILYGVEITTAERLFADEGTAVATRIAEDEVIGLSVGAAVSLMGRLSGNLPLTLPQAVGELPAGELTLTPLQAARVLRFTAWEQGGVAQAQMHAELTAAFLRQTMTLSCEPADAFGVLTEVCDGRLHISQFAAVEDELRDFCAQTDVRCTARVAPGATVGVGERYRYVCE